MAAILMNSTEFAQQMEEAGIPRAQADVIAKGLATMVVHNFDALVTKDYLDVRFGEFEARIGTELFDRSCSPVRLTAGGRRLWAEIAPALDRIDQAIATERAHHRALTLSVSTSFATWWLLPRLGSFKAQNPEIELR